MGFHLWKLLEHWVAESGRLALRAWSRQSRTVASDPRAYHPWERCNRVPGSSQVVYRVQDFFEAIRVTQNVLEPGWCGQDLSAREWTPAMEGRLV